MSDTATPAGEFLPAGFFRRFAALVYDGLLLVAVLFLGTLLLLPLTGGEAITPAGSGVWEYGYRAWIVALITGFFGISWTRRGQTLGMMSWKIRLLREDGRALRWRHALARLATGLAMALLTAGGLWLLSRSSGPAGIAAGLAMLAPVLANYAWIGVDPYGRSLQDRLTGCRVERIRRGASVSASARSPRT